jgi:ABC-type branched-subunit amino acid transport system substrate-binding protein
VYRFADKRVFAAIAACVALAVAGCGSSSSNGGGSSSAAVAAKDTGTNALVVAAFNPFSGPDASFGPEEMAGCIPAAAAVQAAGGILNHKQISCKAVDSRGDPADAVPAAESLIATTGGLIGIIGPSSDEATATVPLFNRAHIPMTGDTGQKVFDHSTFPYFFRITAPDDAVGYAMALYAHNKGYTRAAGVFGADISSQGTAPTAQAGFQHLGGQIMMQKIPLDQASYRTEVLQVAGYKPQVIFTEADPQTDGTYMAELRQLYHLVPIIGTNGTNQPPWFKAVGGAIGSNNLLSYYAGAQPYAPLTGASYDAWHTELNAVSKQVPQPVSQWETDSYSMSYWDTVNLYALAAEMAKSTNPQVFTPDIVKVTTPKAGAVIVHDFAAGKAALLAGKQIQYIGAVGPITFDQWRNSPGEFEVVKANTALTPIVTYTAQQVAAAR